MYTPNQIDSAFRRSGFKKYELSSAREEVLSEVTEDEIMDELNCRLEYIALHDEMVENLSAERTTLNTVRI